MITPKIKPLIKRLGFTLVELLIAIAIMGVMAGMVLYTLVAAQEDAKRSKTKVTIEKLNAIILERFEEYRYRSVRLPIPSSFTRRDPARPNAIPLMTPKAMAKIRTVALKDTMRMEMPDRYSDLSYVPTFQQFLLSDNSTHSIDEFGGRVMSREYNVLRNHFNLASIAEPYVPSVVGATPEITIPYSTSRPAWSATLDAAECLYAIVAHSFIAGGSALEGFHASEIGDVDVDSFPEFVDAWGNPIGWLRWPAGYPSDLNFSYKSTPDAFDQYKTDPQWGTGTTQKPWTLVPLILSAGPDGDFGIDFASSAIYATTRNAYFPITDSPAVGAVVNANALADNITSHDLLLE